MYIHEIFPDKTHFQSGQDTTGGIRKENCENVCAPISTWLEFEHAQLRAVSSNNNQVHITAPCMRVSPLGTVRFRLLYCFLPPFFFCY